MAVYDINHSISAIWVENENWSGGLPWMHGVRAVGIRGAA